MAGEIVPSDLNIPGEPSSRGKVAPSQHHNRPRCPYWHWLALGLTFAGNVVLLRVVMALAVRASSESAPIDPNGTSANSHQVEIWPIDSNGALADSPRPCLFQSLASNNHPQRNFLQGSLNQSLTGADPKMMENENSAQPSPKGSGCSDLEEFRSHLRQHLCYTQNNQSAEGSSCKLCPKDWLLHGDKCYWVSTAIKSWEWSRDNCLMKRAQLLVIDDREEMASIGNITRDQHQVWIGLNITSPGRTWTWQDGSPLNQTLFPILDPSEDSNCASVKKNKIDSEICQTELKWICQKAAVLV